MKIETKCVTNIVRKPFFFFDPLKTRKERKEMDRADDRRKKEINVIIMVGRGKCRAEHTATNHEAELDDHCKS